MADLSTDAASPDGERRRHDHDVLAAIDRLAATWTDQRTERFQRRHLERADFDAVADTGFLRLIVPADQGGLWRSFNETGPVIVKAIRRLAEADQSVALVASMHPTVLGFWASVPTATPSRQAAWDEQRATVFQTALDGHFWGTITSEPGSGGDVLATKATARPNEDGTTVALSGEKHFGSGSQIVSYMVTTAKAPVDHTGSNADGPPPTVGNTALTAGGDSVEMPMAFYIDLRDQPWDGTGGLHISRQWDGMGMKATQSHAVMLDGVSGVPWVWQQALLLGAPMSGALGLTMFCSVIAAVCDAAMTEAERRLGGRQLRPYEEVALTQAQIDHWMLDQAMNGLLATLATEQAPTVLMAATKAKMGMAALAEGLLSQICRAVGGGAFSASSPFATWYEDVRALGYLRPPWGLAFDQLAAARQQAQ